MRTLLRPLALGVFLTVGCGDGGDAAPPPSPDEIAPAPAPEPEVAPSEEAPSLGDDQLLFATVFVAEVGSAPIRLRDGEWADESTGRAVTLTPAPRFRGDLDADGQEEVAAILVVASTTGFDTFLVALGAGAGRATQEAILDLGPMVTVRTMRVDGRAVVLETMRLPSPGQPPQPPREERFLLERGGWSRVGG